MKKEAYFVYVDSEVGIYIPDTKEIRHAPRDKFVQFAEKMIEAFPDYRLKVVLNQGIIEKVRRHIRYEKIRLIRKIRNGKDK